MSRHKAEITIAQILENRSNDFYFLEKEFLAKTGQTLLQTRDFAVPDLAKEGVSIVIPVFNSNSTLILTLRALEKFYLSRGKLLMECIVVDDGSSEDTYKVVKQFKKLPVTFIKLPKRGGSATARRVGVRVAKNDIIIFLDSDVVISDKFISNHVIIHTILRKNNLIVVSFRENIKISNPKLKFSILKNRDIDTMTDFRKGATIQEEWGASKYLCGKFVAPLVESNFFKDFGQGRKIGVWNLPMMGLTCAMSCRRSAILKFNYPTEIFHGWGFNDTVLCAMLLANGAYLIPNFNSSVLHIHHCPRSGSKSKKYKDFNRNKRIYYQLLNKPLNNYLINK